MNLRVWQDIIHNSSVKQKKVHSGIHMHTTLQSRTRCVTMYRNYAEKLLVRLSGQHEERNHGVHLYISANALIGVHAPFVSQHDHGSGADSETR